MNDCVGKIDIHHGGESLILEKNASTGRIFG